MKNKLAVNNFWGNIMTETKTPVTETDNHEEQNKQSDARIILGPLVKYAAVGLVLVGIIITTAVMLDRQFNDIDREVAELQAQLAQANMDTAAEANADNSARSPAKAAPAVAAETVKQEPAVSAAAETAVAEKPAAIPVVENSQAATPAVTQTAAQAVKKEVTVTESTVAEAAVAEDTVVEATVADETNRHSDFFDKSFDELIAERNNYLKERDRLYLEEFKASLERQLQFMRERFAHQDQRIQEMEKRNQEIYDYRAASIKERQQRRESYPPDRI
jgi:hypothetical protein